VATAWRRSRHDSARPALPASCSLDVPIRVERLEGGETVGDATTVVYEEREACGLGGGWEVQSAAGPSG